MGGDCLNTGCVPCKALIRSASLLAHARRAEEFGLTRPSSTWTLPEVMERVQAWYARSSPMTRWNVTPAWEWNVMQGEARIASPFTVEIDGRRLTTAHIVVASGARPFVPPIPGLDQLDYLTSDNFWELRAAAPAPGGAGRRPHRL